MICYITDTLQANRVHYFDHSQVCAIEPHQRPASGYRSVIKLADGQSLNCVTEEAAVAQALADAVQPTTTAPMNVG